MPSSHEAKHRNPRSGVRHCLGLGKGWVVGRATWVTLENATAPTCVRRRSILGSTSSPAAPSRDSGCQTMLWTVKKALYRTQQRVMKTAAAAIPFPFPGLLTGPGSVEQLAENIRLRGLERVLLVTDKILMELELPRGLLQALEARLITNEYLHALGAGGALEQVQQVLLLL